MKFRFPLFVVLLLASIAFSLAAALPAQSEGMDDTMILVAKRQLRDQLYGATILIVKPLGEDRHVGFIINKPTQMTLGKLFPNHGPSQKIADPVYLGGPFNSQVIFALVQRSESPGGRSVRIAPDLYLAIDSSVVDHIIESEPRSVLSNRLMAEIAFDAGGDVERAAGADPEDAIRALLRKPSTRRRRPAAKPSVWRSNRQRAS